MDTTNTNLKAHPSESDVQQSKIEVRPELADKINALREELREVFGCDFAYTIMGRGEIIAASNLRYGTILPKGRTVTL